MGIRGKDAPRRVPAAEEMLRGSALLLPYGERVHFIAYQLSNGGKETMGQQWGQARWHLSLQQDD